jgi:ATP-dependent Lhr-like helicase
MDELLEASGIPIHHWHGDVSASHKADMLRSPSGILQITPESLESMLINRSNDLPRLFGGLRWVVIDEVHTLFGSDRGNQIICLLSRLAAKTGVYPRRIGLSATVGDLTAASEWLGEGSRRTTAAPVPERQKLRWRLGLEHFYINDTPTDGRTDAYGSRGAVDAGYDYLYSVLRGKHALVFSNSREETEYVTATLRQIADRRGEEDVFMIHHGNLSASLREDAEVRMREADRKTVTCATVTMELGIDIGKLERVVQNSSPNSVSSLLQRLGRSGRRGQPPEMMLVFREENPLPNTPLPQLIPWELLRAIAIVQLYIEERFIEPPRIKKMPFSLAFHQTLSVLASSGELTPRALAERILSLPPLSGISKEDYKTLMISMIENDYIEMTEEKGLIVGLAGERLISSFKFYAVFKDSEDFTVRHESEEIGTITTPPPVGDRFALAGRVWEVEELDVARKLIYVKPVEGKMEVSWPGDYGEIHTKILQRMRRVLEEDTIYPYLKPNAIHRLEVARHLARNTGMLEHSIVHLGGYSWCVFPWLGTRAFRTFRKFLAAHAFEYRISGIEHEAGSYIVFKMERGNDYLLARGLAEAVERNGIDPITVIASSENPVFDKYDEYLPNVLLQKAYAADKLDPTEAEKRIIEIFNEYSE